MSAIAVLPIDSHLVYENDRGRRAYPMSPVRYGRAMATIVPYRAWLEFKGASDPVSPHAPYVRIQGEVRRLATIPGDDPFVATSGIVVDKLDYAPEDCPIVDAYYEFDRAQIADLIEKGLYTREFQADGHVPQIFTRATYEVPVKCSFRVMWNGHAMWEDVRQRALEDGNALIAADAERAMRLIADDEAVPVVFSEVENPGHLVMTLSNTGYDFASYYEPVKRPAPEADFDKALPDSPFSREGEPEVRAIEDEAPAKVVAEAKETPDEDFEVMAKAAAEALAEREAAVAARKEELARADSESLPEGFSADMYVLDADAPADEPREEESVEDFDATKALDIRDIFSDDVEGPDSDGFDAADEGSVASDLLARASADDATRRRRDALADVLFGGEEAASAKERKTAAEEATEDYERDLDETMALKEGNENTVAYLVADGSMSAEEAGAKIDVSYMGDDGAANLAADYGEAVAKAAPAVAGSMAAMVAAAAADVASREDDIERDRERSRRAAEREIASAPADVADSPEMPERDGDDGEFDALFGDYADA